MAYIIAGWSFFVFIVWMPVEYAHAAFCFNNYDLGIYGQALTLISAGNLNPFLSTRDIRIFNDHFDPILFLFAPFAKFVAPSLLAIRIEMASIVLASCAPIWLCLNRLISKFQMLLVFFVILFSPMTLMAAFYPSHPGTWALAPLAWMLAFLYARRDYLAIAALTVLLACKEEFPVVGMLLGGVLIVQSRKRVGFVILAMSGAWFCAVFFLRPIFLGQADYYTSAMMSANGVNGIGMGTWPFLLAELLFWVFMPVLLLRVHTFTGFNSFKFDSFFVICMSIAFLLVAIRVVGGYWGNHRAAPLAVLAGFMLIGTSECVSKSYRFRRILFFAFLLATAAPSLDIGIRMWIYKPFKKHCPASPGRVEALNQVVSHLTGVGAAKVLAGGNIVPHLVHLPGIAQIGATKGEHFRFFVVEKHDERNTWPISSAEMKQVEDEWRNRPGVKVLRDDQYVVLLENLSEQ